jgi:hypothetical protein
VESLSDALSPEYDSFYESLPTVSYSVCEDGYIVAAEGPQWGDFEVAGSGSDARKLF